MKAPHMRTFQKMPQHLKDRVDEIWTEGGENGGVKYWVCLADGWHFDDDGTRSLGGSYLPQDVGGLGDNPNGTAAAVVYAVRHWAVRCAANCGGCDGSAGIHWKEGDG